jgi:xanthine dehydrogenase accessory factor
VSRHLNQDFLNSTGNEMPTNVCCHFFRSAPPRRLMSETLKAHAFLAGFPAGCGLATVTAVEGSSYRRPGARLVLAPDGTRLGSISGGCLEEDLLIHLRRVMETGEAKALIYDTTEENDLVWGVGLGCHGRVTLLLERVETTPPGLAFVQDAAGVLRSSTVLATVYAGGPAVQLGACLALAANGRSWHAAEAQAWVDAFRETAADALSREVSAWRSFADLPGWPSVFFEYVAPPPRLVVLGAGDDARPLVRFATDLGWAVTVADPRAAFATRERFPSVENVLVVPPAELAQSVSFDGRTFAVVMTHHYVHDLPYLRELLAKNLPYVGLLGPRKRAEKLLSDLRAEGIEVTPAMHASLHAPVGLDLGGDTPEAVALSMLAEMQAILQGRDATPLRQRTLPIHA